MNELVIGSSAMFGRTKKEIRIHTKCQKSPLVVEADRGQIGQVLLNLYVNAWQAMLNRLGYCVIVSREGLEAVKIIAKMGNEIDMVILDLVMSGMDGGKTFDRIREIRPGMPVLLSSGYAINGHADKICKGAATGSFKNRIIFLSFHKKLEKCWR